MTMIKSKFINVNHDSAQEINEFNPLTPKNIQEIKIKRPQLFTKESCISLTKAYNKEIQEINKKPEVEQHLESKKIACFNILIVDDDPFNLLILSQYLSKLNGQYKMNISKAFHGQQIIQIQAFNMFLQNNKSIGENNLTYIILDCQMPIMDGYETSKLIKTQVEKENYVNAVVIGYTADAGEEVEAKCKSVSMDGYILKPANEKQFLEYFRSYLK